MKFLILSNKHELLPFGHRLRREGHDVEVVVAKASYERAWDGKARKLLRASEGQVTPENLELVIKAAREGEVAVMTNLWRAQEWFAGSPFLWPTLHNDTPGEPGQTGLPPCRDVLQFGGWFQDGFISLPHLLVVDWGAWPGGMGAVVPSAATLVRIDQMPADSGPFQACIQEAGQRLKDAHFQGLFRFTLSERPDGTMELAGLDAGWHPLHAHAFLAELEGLNSLLLGLVEHHHIKTKFVFVILLTIPPWPTPGDAAELPISGLTPKQRGSVWWHDVVVDTENKRLSTAGLDGRVGVVVGSAHNLELARARAFEICQRVQLTEKQYRIDAGLGITRVLATLEDRFGFLV